MKVEKMNIQSTISEIKKAEGNKEVEDAVIEDECETLSNISKISEEDIKDLNINQAENEKIETKQILLKFAERIHKKVKDYNAIYLYLNSENIKLVNIEKLKIVLDELEEMQSEAKNVNEQVGDIVDKIILPEKAKIKILIEYKNGNSEEVFENIKIAYGDINEELCKKAFEIYNDKLKFLDSRKNLFRELDNDNLKEALKHFKSACKYTDEYSADNDENWHKEKLGAIKKEREENNLEKLLENNRFNAEDIKNYFEIALIKGGLENSGYKVIIDSNAKSIGVYGKHPRYDGPVILIPKNKEVDGIKLLELIAHEIGGHIASGFYNNKQGLGAISLGRDWEIYNEGSAKMNEIEINKEILGNSYLDFKVKASPYYVLAMEKIKNGGDYEEVYKYIFDLAKKEFLTEGRNNSESKEEAKSIAEKICRRVYRGFDKKEKGKYFTKDLSYLAGELGVEEMKKRGVDKYLYLSKVDPELIADLIKMRVYIYKKGLIAAKDVAKQMWQDKGWPVDYIKDKGWYEENTQMDRHWVYRKEYMSEDMTDIAES